MISATNGVPGSPGFDLGQAKKTLTGEKGPSVQGKVLCSVVTHPISHSSFSTVKSLRRFPRCLQPACSWCKYLRPLFTYVSGVLFRYIVSGPKRLLYNPRKNILLRCSCLTLFDYRVLNFPSFFFYVLLPFPCFDGQGMGELRNAWNLAGKPKSKRVMDASPVSFFFIWSP